MPVDAPIHVCGLVVHVSTVHAAQARRAIPRIRGAEVSAHDDDGRLVVLLETRDEGEILAAFRELEALDGVLSVALVYHHAEAA